jgi:hypothetical protein
MRLVLLLCLFCGVRTQPYRWYYTGQLLNDVVLPDADDPQYGIFKGSVVAYRSLFVAFPVDGVAADGIDVQDYSNSTAHWLFNGGSFIKLEKVMRSNGEDKSDMHRMDDTGSLASALDNELSSAATITSIVVSKYDLFCSANYAVQEGAKSGPGASVPNSTE